MIERNGTAASDGHGERRAKELRHQTVKIFRIRAGVAYPNVLAPLLVGMSELGGPLSPSFALVRSKAGGKHPAPLKRFFHCLLVLLGCLHLAGGPHSLLQVYAWANMLVTYSQKDGLVEAAKDTFSGEKPCELCCKIAQARKAEPAREKSPAPLPPELLTKLVQQMLPAEEPFLASPSPRDFPLIEFTGPVRPVGMEDSSPAVPPPRRLA